MATKNAHAIATHSQREAIGLRLRSKRNSQRQNRTQPRDAINGDKANLSQGSIETESRMPECHFCE